MNASLTQAMAGSGGAGGVEIARAGGLQVGVELDQQRIAGGDLDADDVVVGHVEQKLDDGAQRIAVRGDDQVLAGLQRRRDGGGPVGHHAVKRASSGFRLRAGRRRHSGGP